MFQGDDGGDRGSGRASWSAVQAEAPAPERAVDAPGYATGADVAPVPLPAAPAEIPAPAPAACSPEPAMDTNAEAAPPYASEPEARTPALPADSSGRLNDADTRGAPAHIAKAPMPAPATGSLQYDHRFVSRTVPCPDPIDPERLRAALAALTPRVLRAKGFVITAAGGPGEEWMVVQACGRTVDLEARRRAAGFRYGVVPGPRIHRPRRSPGRRRAGPRGTAGLGHIDPLT